MLFVFDETSYGLKLDRSECERGRSWTVIARYVTPPLYWGSVIRSFTSESHYLVYRWDSIRWFDD